jgi:ABC-2 type transport system ATP-binding protein
VITLDSVSKSYAGGSVKAVDDLSLEVPSGQIFGFLGPNGAGKTTTIKMIVGLLRPDSGQICINGINALQEPIAAKQKIGFVPDNPEVYERLTGVEYVNFMADVFGVPANVRQKRIEELLEMFEMKDAFGDLIQSYSHGMHQKIVLIGALVHDPEVMIMDEPMVGLDPRSSHLLKEVMRERCDAGKTVFFSTHVLEVAEKICDTIGIINKGRLISHGTMSELREQAGKSESLENIFLELTE